tara:strand:- start:409 stop:561 length:153 start_codon:yes stop_codon:yes gene_type:complete
VGRPVRNVCRLLVVVECCNDIWRHKMGRSILLWFLGVPIPIIILLALFWH